MHSTKLQQVLCWIWKLTLYLWNDLLFQSHLLLYIFKNFSCGVSYIFYKYGCAFPFPLHSRATHTTYNEHPNWSRLKGHCTLLQRHKRSLLLQIKELTHWSWKKFKSLKIPANWNIKEVSQKIQLSCFLFMFSSQWIMKLKNIGSRSISSRENFNWRASQGMTINKNFKQKRYDRKSG